MAAEVGHADSQIRIRALHIASASRVRKNGNTVEALARSLMASLVILFSITMILIGAYGIASPGGLASFVRSWEGPLGVWVGSATRILLGVALWSAAPSSRAPAVLKILGVVSLLSGIALPFIGASRLTRLISWWSGKSPTFHRGWSAAAVAVGAFLFWSIVA
jgi:hypothetical protein